MDRLYYISQGRTPDEHIDHIEKVCQAGIQLVQLRMKQSSEKVLIPTALEVKKVCEKYGAQLIINDHIEVALEVNADGVHLGKEDSSPLKARTLWKEKKIIGATAHTLSDCLSLMSQGVDYIGLGPFRWTVTKKNLSPLLGLRGYREIISALEAKAHSPPIYGIGGIRASDFESIYGTGMHGVAVSGILSYRSVTEIKKVLHQSRASAEASSLLHLSSKRAVSSHPNDYPAFISQQKPSSST